MKKVIRSKEYDITLNVPLRGFDKLYRDWSLFVGDIIKTPLGEGIITGKVHNGGKVGVIVKLKKTPAKFDKRIIKGTFFILNYNELKRWKENLSKQGESIFIGTVKPERKSSILKRSHT